MVWSVWTYYWELVHYKLPSSGCIWKLQSSKESSLMLLIYLGLMGKYQQIVFSGAGRFRSFQRFMGQKKALASNWQGSIMKQGGNLTLVKKFLFLRTCHNTQSFIFHTTCRCHNTNCEYICIPLLVKPSRWTGNVVGWRWSPATFQQLCKSRLSTAL